MKASPLFAVLCILVLASNAWGTGPTETGGVGALTVHNANDSGPGSLRQTIADASSGDSILFAPSLAGQTITLTSAHLSINKNLTLDGSGLDSRVKLSGGSAWEVFYIFDDATVTVRDLDIVNGRTSGSMGGGIWNYRSTLTIERVWFSGNDAAAGAGGGIFNNAGSVTVSDSTFSDNSARYGGGVYNAGGTMTINNCTFSSNEVTRDGGAIYNTSWSTLYLNNSTLSGNRAYSGGAIYNQGFLHYRNNILADSIGADGDLFNIGQIVTNVRNLVETTNTYRDLSGDPQLGPLQDNGGPTLTFALGAGSPAIDAGDSASCLATDQRAQPRNDLACDVGAFELKLVDSSSITKSIPGSGTYTFGPAMVKIVIASGRVGTLSQLTVLRLTGDHPGHVGTPDGPGVGWGEYWTLIPNSGASGFRVRLTFPTLFTPNAHTTACRYSSAMAWNCAVSGFDPSAETVTRDLVDAFSDWAVGNNFPPAAVRLTAFRARTPLTGSTSLGAIAFLALAAAAVLGVLAARRRPQAD